MEDILSLWRLLLPVEANYIVYSSRISLACRFEKKMDSAAILVLLALLTAFVNDAAASCREVANDEMLEYFCEGGYPADLDSLPPRTEKLRITRMPLRRITAETFSRFNRNLMVLSCVHCEITEIDADAFRDLVNLQQLNLESNYLTTVKASWFKDLTYLTYLDLSYNHVRDIEDDVYENLRSLVDLRISGNRLRCLNLDEMSHLNELKRIFLGENSEFACPHAVSKFLRDRSVVFEEDPEWRKLANDVILVDVPPYYAEKDRTTAPAYRERPQPNRRPSSEETRHDVPLTRNGNGLYPDHRSEHTRMRNRRPHMTTTMRPATPKTQDRMPVPRVEPRYPSADPRTPNVSTESSHEAMHHPYSTLETPRAPPVEMESSLEDIGMAEADKSSETERTPPYTLVHETITRQYPTSYPTYPPHSPPPSHLPQATSYPTYPPYSPRPSYLPQATSYPTYPPHSPRPSHLPQATSYPTYPPHSPRPSYLPHPSYPTAEEDAEVRESEFLDHEKAAGAGKALEMENAVYPQHDVRVTTSYDQERAAYESGKMTHPPPNDFDTRTSRTSMDASTNAPSEHPDNPSWMQDKTRYEQSLHLTTDNGQWIVDNGPSTNRPDFQTTYRGGHDPYKMLDRGSDTDDPVVAAGQDKADLSQTTVPNVAYVRPSLPPGVHSPSTGQFYQTYHETKMPPPLLIPNEESDEATVGDLLLETTTDKPTECPNNSALKIRPDTMLVISVIIAVFQRVIAEGF